MDAQNASRRIDALLNKTLTAVHPRLKWRDGPAEITQHMDSLNEPTGAVTVSRARYVRNKVSKEKLQKLFAAVETSWKNAGYGIENVNRREPSCTGRTPDDLRISFSVGGNGNVYFGASADAKDPQISGDVLPGEEGDEFPEGQSGPEIAPDVDDPYWSR
jgi:hypothetical protein